MTTLSMGSKTWVLLNTPRAVNEILSKRASATHERPYFPIAGSLVSRERRYFLLPSADLLDGRRLIHRLLLGGPSPSLDSDSPGSRSHMPTDEVIQTASLNFLKSYLDEPQTWYQHNYRYPASIIYQMVTGTPLQQSTAELNDFQLVTSSFLTSMNSHFVDFFPQLATLIPIPLQFWRAKWLAMGKFHYAVMRRWWDGILRSQNAGEKGSSFVQDVLESEYANNARTGPEPASGMPRYSLTGQDTALDQKHSMSLQEERAMYLTMFVLSAGADNPRMTLNAFIMACMAYPRAVRRAREDLDRLCGGLGADNSEMRLPTLDDLPQLPYIAAIVKEVLRWRPTVPLTPQRVSVRDLDVTLDGLIYNFPKGTEFLVNTVAVCKHTSQTGNSSEGYDSPEKFRPERWLNTDNTTDGKNTRGIRGSYTGVEQDLWQFAFSAGRRSCSGYKLAQKELFLGVAGLLYCFDFVATDTEGKEGKVNDKVLNAFSLGEPFPVKVRVRSILHEELIRAL